MKDSELFNMAMSSSRSTIAVLDAMFQRGAVKGEEAATVGNLRSQHATLASAFEDRISELNAEAEKPNKNN